MSAFRWILRKPSSLWPSFNCSGNKLAVIIGFEWGQSACQGIYKHHSIWTQVRIYRASTNPFWWQYHHMGDKPSKDISFDPAAPVLAKEMMHRDEKASVSISIMALWTIVHNISMWAVVGEGCKSQSLQTAVCDAFEFGASIYCGYRRPCYKI